MNKFLLAENPMRPDNSGCFLIHMLDPIAIIRCEVDHIDYPPGKLYAKFSFRNSDGILEDWTLSIHHLFTQELDSEQHHSIVNHILSRGWRWYRAYMEWEDKNIDANEKE